MISWIPILTATVAGALAVVGYLVQKHLERMHALADQRREAYTLYFRTMFQRIDSGRESDRAEEVYWRTRLLLFASDDVIEKVGVLQDLLTPNGPVEGCECEIHSAFDDVLLAMRREIVGSTKVKLEDVQRLSPLLD